MQLKKILVLFISITLCLSSQATFIPLTVQEIDGSPSVSKVKNITFNGATLTDLLNGRVLVTVSSAATAAGSTGAIQFNNSNALAADSSNLFWDNTNKRLGIGTNSPSQKLNVVNGQILFRGNGANPPGLTIWGDATTTYISSTGGVATANLRVGSTNNSSTAIYAHNGPIILEPGPYNGQNRTQFGPSSIDTRVYNPNEADFMTTVYTVDHGMTDSTALIEKSHYKLSTYFHDTKLPAIQVQTIDTVNGAYVGISNNINFLPKAKLHVNGSTIIESQKANTAALRIKGFTSQTANLQEWQNNAGTALAAISNGGNLGVGTASPARKLHISQAMRIDPISGSQPSSPMIGDIYVDGDTNTLCFYDGTLWTALGGGSMTCN
jgi:hypothetical protein